MLLSLEHAMGGFNPTNLVIMQATIVNGGNLDPIVIFKKLMSLVLMGLVYFKVVTWVLLSRSNIRLLHLRLMFIAWWIKQIQLSKPSIFFLCSITLTWSCDYFTNIFFSFPRKQFKFAKSLRRSWKQKAWRFKTMSIYVEPIHLGVAKIPFVIVEDDINQPCNNSWCFKLEHLVDVETLLNLACIVLILSVVKN
jgi:hypothetical protein